MHYIQYILRPISHQTNTISISTPKPHPHSNVPDAFAPSCDYGAEINVLVSIHDWQAQARDVD